MDKINDGNFIIIQRNNYLRIQKFNSKKPIVKLGKESGNRPRTIDFSSIEGKNYETIYKMVPDEQNEQGWRLEFIENCAEAEELYKNDCQIEGENVNVSGEDNRNLLDANSSQELTREDIESMQEQRIEGSKIIERLVESSTSFNQKTKFSQEKFIKKKTKKYCQYIKIRRPSVRLILQIRSRDLPRMKSLNLRVDSLAQIINTCNVRSGGKYIVFDNASQGLIIASALERIITRKDGLPSPLQFEDSGKIVHIYFTGNPQTQCLGEMNFHSDALSSYLTTLNMFHLRSLEQGVDIVAMGQQELTKKFERKRKHEDDNAMSDSTNMKKIKEECDDDNIESNNGVKVEPVVSEVDKDEEMAVQNDLEDVKEPLHVPYRQKMREESTLSYNMIRERNMDGLIIAAKQHPTNILLHLMKYLAPSRPFVVFSSYKEPLMDAYFAVKETGKAVFVTLTETWLRNYQVLPDRTHPEVLMSGGGGYILSGIVVDNTDPPEDSNGPSQNAVNGHSNDRKNKRFRRR